MKQIWSPTPFLVGFCGANLLVLACATAAPAQMSAADAAARAERTASLAGLPLYFEANRGQAGTPAQFVARGRDYQFLIQPTEALLVLRQTEGLAPASPFERGRFIAPRAVATRVVRLGFAGANPQARILGAGELPGKINYFIGDDPAQWHAGVATYARVQVEGLYPGINLEYYGNQQQLEYDLAVAPGADAAVIAINFEGADEIAVNQHGELVLKVAGSEIRQPRPALYQNVGGQRKPVNGGYRLTDARVVGFNVGEYDHDLPLVIDPILSYSTYFGGNVGDVAVSVKVGSTGAVYVAGITLSSAFPFTIPPGSYTNKFQGGTFNGDAFVAKFDQSGTNLLFFTYLGGSRDDGAYDMALDSAGNVYLTGFTDSTNFPVKVPTAGVPNLPRAAFISGSPDTNAPHAYPVDAFVAELDASGSNLVYSLYLGGSDVDVGDGIAVDLTGNAYVTGYTYSTNFPTTTNSAFQAGLGGTNRTVNAFLVKVATQGTNLAYASYLGGTNFDKGEGVAVDAAGFAYVAGYTASTNFPTTADGYQTNFNNSTNAAFDFAGLAPPFDAFLAKFDTTRTGSTSLAYCTFLGGTNNDAGNRIAVDVLTNVYVTGYSYSADFPNTTTNLAGLQVGVSTNLGTVALNADAFLTKFNFSVNPPVLAFSALFGGSYDDMGWGVAVDPEGKAAYVVGITASTNFPTLNTSGLLRATNAGGNDVFVLALTNDASALLYSAYLGGSGDDYGFGIAADRAGNGYIVGRTLSTNFLEVTSFESPLQRTNNAFLAKISLGAPPTLAVALTGTNLQLQWPGFIPEYALETSTNLAGANWIPVPQNGAVNGYQTATLPDTNSAAFFRLHKP